MRPLSCAPDHIQGVFKSSLKSCKSMLFSHSRGLSHPWAPLQPRRTAPGALCHLSPPGGRRASRLTAPSPGRTAPQQGIPTECWGLLPHPRHCQDGPAAPEQRPAPEPSSGVRPDDQDPMPHPLSPHRLLLQFLPMSVPDLSALRALPRSWYPGAGACRLCVSSPWDNRRHSWETGRRKGEARALPPSLLGWHL